MPPSPFPVRITFAINFIGLCLNNLYTQRTAWRFIISVPYLLHSGSGSK